MENWWSAPTPWSGVCRRTARRRAYNRKWQLAAAVRRGAIAKQLWQMGLRRGVQVELSRRLQVSKSTISQNIRRLLARPDRPTPHACGRKKGRPTTAGRQGRNQRAKERRMARRLTVRLDQGLHYPLRTVARLRHTTLSAIARHDGETLTAEDVQQLCGAMMMLGQYGGLGALPHPEHPGRDA
jgi:hypothetical protein